MIYFPHCHMFWYLLKVLAVCVEVSWVQLYWLTYTFNEQCLCCIEILKRHIFSSGLHIHVLSVANMHSLANNMCIQIENVIWLHLDKQNIKSLQKPFSAKKRRFFIIILSVGWLYLDVPLKNIGDVIITAHSVAFEENYLKN